MIVKVYADFPVLGRWTVEGETKMGLYDASFVKILKMEDSQALIAMNSSSLTLDGVSISLEETNYDLETLHIRGTAEVLSFSSAVFNANHPAIDLFPVPSEEGNMVFFMRINEDDTKTPFTYLTGNGWETDEVSAHIFSKDMVENGDKCEIIVDEDEENTLKGNLQLIYNENQTLKEVKIPLKKAGTLTVSEDFFDLNFAGVHNRWCALLTQEAFDSLKN